MSNDLLSIFVKFILGPIVGVGTGYVISWYKERKQKKLCVSKGLATGYYYNFIKDIFEEEKIKVIPDGGTEQLFDTKTSVFLEVIMPSKLTEAHLAHARNYEISNTIKGRIDLGNNWTFSVHYNIGVNRLTIIDMANPLGALAKYIGNLPQFNRLTTDNDKKLAERQDEESENFKKTIQALSKKIGFGDGKIIFKDENGTVSN